VANATSWAMPNQAAMPAAAGAISDDLAHLIR
jgi:hypothetical protein